MVAFWHTPAFLLSGTKQFAWAFWPFFFGVVAISVTLTPMFNAARASLLVSFLYIKWPGASRLDVRDHVSIYDVLNELGQDGWELVSERPTVGINTTDYTLRRPKRR